MLKEQLEATAEVLNSGHSYVLLSPSGNFIWHGRGGSPALQEGAREVVNRLQQAPPGQGQLSALGAQFEEVAEGQEPAVFWELLGGQEEYPADQELGCVPLRPRLLQAVRAPPGGPPGAPAGTFSGFFCRNPSR